MELFETENIDNYRFDIEKDILDMEHKRIDNGQVIIPIKRPNDSFLYDDIFELFEREKEEECNRDQIPQLDLVLQAVGKIFFGAMIETDFDDTYIIKEIHLNKSEREVVKQLLVA